MDNFTRLLMADTILCIADNLSPQDAIALAICNESMYQMLSDKLDSFQQQCRCQVQDKWNELAPLAEIKAKSNDDKYKSPVCYGYEVTMTDSFYCSIYENKIHSIHVTYVHNPRDVDILAWYEGDQRIGYTYL